MLPSGQFQFDIVGHVGEGGLGVVDRIRVTASNCRHPVGSEFARKRLNDNWKDHPNARERFEREIKAIARMNHPAIISFQGENLDGGERFYVMPLYPRSLRDYIMSHSAGVEWRSVANFGARLADACYHAHKLGYIHRDLKPENILLDHAENPVISDWGLGYFVHKDSKVLDLTRGGMGTEYYCSMEQWMSGKCDERGDIYSLGILLAELVRGYIRIPVIPGMGLEQDAVIGNVFGSLEFNQYLRRMTRPLVNQRPMSMLEVAAELRRTAGGAAAA